MAAEEEAVDLVGGAASCGGVVETAGVGGGGESGQEGVEVGSVGTFWIVNACICAEIVKQLGANYVGGEAEQEKN